MSRKRKVYSASFRAQVALAAARGDKTVNEIAAQFEVSPQMVLKMKARLKERIEDIFQVNARKRKRTKERSPRKNCSNKLVVLKLRWTG